MNTRLAKVFYTYRVTPQSTTGISPAELLLHRQPRTHLDLLHPNTPLRVEQVQKQKYDLKARSRSFQNGDLVYVKNFSPGPQWVPGNVLEVSGPVSYVIQLNNGRQRRCHIDHLRAQLGDTDTDEMSQIIPEDSIPFVPTTTETATPTVQSETETTTSEPIVPTTTSTPTFSAVDDIDILAGMENQETLSTGN